MNLYRLICLLLLMAFGGAAWPQTLHVMTTEVPPFAFVKDGKQTGFCIEIVEEIQRRLGRADAIDILPWARAYRQAQLEKNGLLVCPKRSPEREALFKWVGPLFNSKTDFLIKSGTTVHIGSLAEARRLKQILVLRDSYSYNYLRLHGFENLYLVNNLSSMLHMLLAERAPAMVLERVQLDAVMREDGVAPGAVKTVLHVQSPSSNLAFSKEVPDKVVRDWQGALDAMKKDGSYSRIFDKWFPRPGIVERT